MTLIGRARPGGPRFSIMAWLCGSLLVACGASPDDGAAPRGQALFESKALSSSSLNDYTCATCHDLKAQPPPPIKTGAALAGVTLRSSFWGGQENELLRAINDCRNFFMADNLPLLASDQDARALYAYLEGFEPGDDTPSPFSV